MPDPVEVTARKLRLSTNLDNSSFLNLYEQLMRGEDMEDAQYVDILRFSIIFLRSEDEVVSRLGYRILLQYSATTHDYEPLHAVAQAKELMPVVVASERIQPTLANEDDLRRVLFNSHRSNFSLADGSGDISARTRGQMELRSFNTSVDNAVIVAPTSYGKSEMMLAKIAERFDRATCVVVPTRALIAQTRAALIVDTRVRESRVRVITHPDAYVNDDHFVAVLTQERLQRLLANNSGLKIDLLLVDEAHNLLSGDPRATELSQVILTALARRPEMSISYYTPFLAKTSSVRFATSAPVPRGKSVNEHVKAERLIHSTPGQNQRLYDQFLNRFITLTSDVPSDEIAAVRALAGLRTLVYVNKPSQAQDLAVRLSNAQEVTLSASGRAAIAAISDLIDPNYSLNSCIRSGVLFHHGKVPDILRQYIERLFKEDSSLEPRFLVTTSTLLEGVNTPADRMIMMSAGKGLGYLSRSEFRNLIGRVGRFSEVFDDARSNLDLLQPEIHLVPSSYARPDWNVESYLQRVADVSKLVTDDIENPLLDGSDDMKMRANALEYLENVEPGASGLAAARRAQTPVGALCFKNGVHDFDIFSNEAEIQRRIDERLGEPISQIDQVIGTICAVFFDEIQLSGEELARVRDNVGARNFYSLFLSWRANNEPYKRMIGHFLRYWSQLDQELVYVGSSWGDETFGEGFRKLYVRMREKSHSERINLAVAKVKEEQDFVDFNLIRYVEILNSLGMIEASIYNQLKYGTADPYLICLLKNGCSPELSRLIRDRYQSHVEVNTAENSLRVTSTLALAMGANDENDILIYEAETLAESD